MKQFSAALMASSLAVHAHALELPGSSQVVVSQVENQGRYQVPLGVFDGSEIPVQRVDGAVRRQVWTVDAQDHSLAQIAADLTVQLEREGFRRILDCASSQCGGFDFRFGIDVLPAPLMYVNLQDFRFLTFLKGPSDAPTEVTTVLASAQASTGYIQIVEIRTTADAFPSRPTKTTNKPEQPARPEATKDLPLSAALFETGAVVLKGLEFSSGTTELGAGPFEALGALAEFLRDNPKVELALVGHTDSTGSFEGNLVVSKARAASVRDRLISAYGANGDKIRAEGMGYLAPRASNLTEAGRDANRRVEAILLSAE